MNMNKLYAGMVAFVAGVALSAGSAFAQTMGYVGGDPAMMKLVPYYETGDMKATIIGVQNMSPQEASTMVRNALVADIQAYLAGGTIAGDGTVVTAINAEGLEQLTVDGNATYTLGEGDLNARAAAEAALETAMEAAYTEHLFVTVSVYDAVGTMHESKNMCLAENQFGVVIIQGPAATMTDTMQRVVFSAMDDDVHEFGYAMVAARDSKFSGCGVTADVLVNVDTSANPGTDTPTYTGANSKVAAWTIIQDVGMGFFGTEVPTTTVSMASNVGTDGAAATGDDGDPEVACYSQPNSETGNADVPIANELPYQIGDFDMTRCGLIPERHNIVLTGTAPNETLDVETDQDPPADDGDSSTFNTTATARYDAGAESTVVVWLAKGEDPVDVLPRDKRMIEVSVACADGMVPGGPDENGDGQPDTVIEIPAPHVLNRIDPTMGDVGDLTSMCDDYRGVLQITMPDYSHAGMVFTHITQMMGQYRLNFPGYSTAPDVEIDAPAP